jgi:hypothetical protein
MRTRILVAEYEMEYEGRARYWNECMRPIFGGPAAKEAPVTQSKPSSPASGTDADEAQAAETPSVAKSGPPRKRKAPAKKSKRSPAPVPKTGPATDIELLYADLAKAGGRRAEKDAVLATVWLLGGTQQDVTFGAVASHVHSVEFFRDVRVKPHLLKHCSRSHMLEPGSERETVRMTKKGIRYIAGLMG